MRILNLLLILVLCCLTWDYAYSLDDAEPEAINGRVWMTMDKSLKTAFVSGMRSGVRVFGSTEIEGDDEDFAGEIRFIFFIAQRTLSPELSDEEIAGMIDEYYLDKLNLNIPVFEIYRIVAINFYSRSNNDVIFDEQEKLGKLRDLYAPVPVERIDA